MVTLEKVYLHRGGTCIPTKTHCMDKAIVIHNSDEVKAVILGGDKQHLLQKLRYSEYWEDITTRLINEKATEEHWTVQREEDITIDRIVGYLHHDGDSEDGYTLLDTK